MQDTFLQENIPVHVDRLRKIEGFDQKNTVSTPGRIKSFGNHVYNITVAENTTTVLKTTETTTKMNTSAEKAEMDKFDAQLEAIRKAGGSSTSKNQLYEKNKDNPTSSSSQESSVDEPETWEETFGEPSVIEHFNAEMNRLMNGLMPDKPRAIVISRVI